MHLTAMENARYFFDCYAASFDSSLSVTVVEIGSQDVNGSIREVCPKHFQYIGIDFAEGKGVDVILKDPYNFPFNSETADIVLSSSCFEHSEMFWLVFLEVMRILKPGGLFYLNTPSNGPFHRYPVDCWRFYPDSGRALVNWAKKNGINAALLESYTSTNFSKEQSEPWNDFVAVFLKDETLAYHYSNRILTQHSNFYNGIILNSNEIHNYSLLPEDQKKLSVIREIARTYAVEGRISVEDWR